MSIETTLRTYLLTDATLTSLISTRLYYALAPQEVVKPYVVYYTLDDPNLKTLIGNDGANPVITFRIVVAQGTGTGVGSAGLVAISEAIRAKIIDFTGTMGTMDIYRITAVNFQDFPPESDSDNLERYCDYQIEYER